MKEINLLEPLRQATLLARILWTIDLRMNGARYWLSEATKLGDGT